MDYGVNDYTAIEHAHYDIHVFILDLTPGAHQPRTQGQTLGTRLGAH